MDDDEIHATMAFLAEFDGAASDEEPQRRLSVQRPAPAIVATTLDSKAAPSRPGTAKKPTAAKKRSKSSRETTTLSETVAVVPSAVVTETVPLAQPKTRKEELEFMREQVKELEERLRLLKRGARREEDQSPLDKQTEQLSGELALVSVQHQQQQPRKPKRIASMWEDLAMRQYQQRQRAEVENLKLKSSLEDQLKVAKSLQRMLKRSKCDVLTPRNHAKRSRILQAKSPAEDAAEFGELSSTVTSMYGELDAAFADARFATADVDFRDVNVRQDDTTGTTIEVLNAKMVPFDFGTTAAAMWDYFINDSMAAQGFFVEHTVERTSDSVMNSVRVELEVKRFCGRFRGKIVGRRYREADRVVIVWAVLAEPVEVSDAPMHGIILRQRGWTIVRKPPTTTELDGDSVAMIQTKHVAIPMLYEDEVPDHKRKLELLTNYVVAIMFHQIDAGQQVVENLLFASLQTAKQSYKPYEDASGEYSLR